MSWGINENASEKEKLKAEINDFFCGLNSTCEIDYEADLWCNYADYWQHVWKAKTGDWHIGKPKLEFLKNPMLWGTVWFYTIVLNTTGLHTIKLHTINRNQKQLHTTNQIQKRLYQIKLCTGREQMSMFMYCKMQCKMYCKKAGNFALFPALYYVFNYAI